MVKLITVEREYGSQGAEFAHQLADTLGWKLIDSCLIEERARRAGVAKDQVSRCDEQLDPWYHRFGKAFFGIARRCRPRARLHMNDEGAVAQDQADSCAASSCN